MARALPLTLPCLTGAPGTSEEHSQGAQTLKSAGTLRVIPVRVLWWQPIHGNASAVHTVTNDDGRTPQAMFSECHTCTDLEGTAGWSLILRESTWLLHREGACPRYDQEMLRIDPQGSGLAQSSCCSPTQQKDNGEPPRYHISPVWAPQ